MKWETATPFRHSPRKGVQSMPCGSDMPRTCNIHHSKDINKAAKRLPSTLAGSVDPLCGCLPKATVNVENGP